MLRRTFLQSLSAAACVPVAVAADGTIGVSYYDFRFNDATSGALTDYWLVYCHPSNRKPATDTANCGTCGNACGAGQSCMSGVCQANCSASQMVCGGMCTNTSFDPSNCNGCGNVQGRCIGTPI